jgi:hypothetical protein
MAYYQDIIINDNGEIKCKLCDCKLTDDDISIESHVKDYNHQKFELKRVLMQQSVVIINNHYYCCVCDHIVDGDNNLRSHLLQVTHKNMLKTVKQLLKSDGSFLRMFVNPVNELLSMNCKLCNCDIEFKAIAEHIGSMRHRRIRAIIVQPYNGIFSVEGDDEHLWCKICKVYIPNYIDVIFDHVDNNEDHITNWVKVLNIIKGQEITLEKFLTDPKEDKVCCKKCNTQVACNVINLNDHIKGNKHKTASS